MRQPLEVKLVEDTPVLGIPGPILIAAAAVVGASLAALVAVWRMRVQLAHDREMKNRDQRRNTLDDAIETANETFRAVTEMVGSVRMAPARRERHLALIESQETSPVARQEARSEVEKIDKNCREAVKKARELDIEMTFQVLRVNLRFGDDGISNRYDSLCDAYSQRIDIAESGVDQALSDDQQEALEKAGEVATERFADLMVACEMWLARS